MTVVEVLAFAFVASLWVCIVAVAGGLGWLIWRAWCWWQDRKLRRGFKAADRLGWIPEKWL